MFKEWRELELEVAETEICEPTIDTSSTRARIIDVIDDNELKRMYSYFHFGPLEMAEHRSSTGVWLDDDYEPSPEDKRLSLQLGLNYELCRKVFYFAIRMRWSELVDVSDDNIWILKGWRIAVVNR